jgi:rhodanese-related sulfurtransferase
MDQITAQELIDQMNSGVSIQIVDVREVWEYEEENIGAVNIPFYDMPQRLDEVKALAEKTLVLHCKTGARSGKAQRYLCSQGIRNCLSLVGGIEQLKGYMEIK